MQPLMDSLLSALLVSDCRDAQPLHRFQRAARRVEQLLSSIGFPETAKTLAKFRAECGECPVELPRELPDVHLHTAIVAEPCDDPLVVRAARKRKAVGNA